MNKYIVCWMPAPGCLLFCISFNVLNGYGVLYPFCWLVSQLDENEFTPTPICHWCLRNPLLSSFAEAEVRVTGSIWHGAHVTLLVPKTTKCQNIASDTASMVKDTWVLVVRQDWLASGGWCCSDQVADWMPQSWRLPVGWWRNGINPWIRHLVGAWKSSLKMRYHISTKVRRMACVCVYDTLRPLGCRRHP